MTVPVVAHSFYSMSTFSRVADYWGLSTRTSYRAHNSQRIAFARHLTEQLVKPSALRTWPRTRAIARTDHWQRLEIDHAVYYTFVCGLVVYAVDPSYMYLSIEAGHASAALFITVTRFIPLQALDHPSFLGTIYHQ